MSKYLLILFLIISSSIVAQTTISLDSAVALALKYHPKIHLADQEIAEQKALKKGSFALENPDIFIESPSATEFTLGFQLTINNPIVYFHQAKVAKHKVLLSEAGSDITKLSIKKDVKTTYLNLQFAEIKFTQLSHQDSIFKNLSLVAQRRHEAGDATLLEKVTAEAASEESRNLLNQAKADLQNAQIQLQIIIGLDDNNVHANELLSKIPIAEPGFSFDVAQALSSPLLQYQKQNISLSKQSLKFARSRLSPGFTLGYLNEGDANSELLYRFQFGLSVPLWFWTYSSRIKAARIRYDMANNQLVNAQLNLNSQYIQAVTDFKKYKESLSYYESSALNRAETIITTATRSFQVGEISYIIYMQSLNQAFNIKMNYYETIRNYNQSIIQLQYLNGQL